MGKTPAGTIKGAGKGERLMKHKLLIHIGMPKTGTSSLQKFMALNNEVLKKNGWNYPDTGGCFGNVGIWESDRYKNDGFLSYVKANILHEEESGAALEKFHERVQSSLKLYDTILSDEGIWLEYGLEYIEYLKDKYPDLILIAYLRRQDFVLESWYGQKIREDSCHETGCFEEWVRREMDREEGSLFYRYYDRLMEFEKIIPRENIIVRTYMERQNFNLCKDFLSILNLENKFNEFHEIRQINCSMSMVDTEVKRKWNEILGKQPINKLADIKTMLQREYWNIYEPVCSSLHMVRFNKYDRKRILERYAGQNEKVSGRYGNGGQIFDNKIDFRPLGINQEETMSQYAGLLEKVLIRICLRNKYPFLSLAFDKGKSVAIFGAGFMGKKMIEHYGLPAEIIIDNNPTLAGQRIEDRKIIAAKDIHKWEKYFVIIAVKESLEIEGQLEALGLKRDLDFMHMDKFLSGE